MGNSACPETFPTVGYLIPAMFQTTSLLFSLIENLNEVSKTTRTTSATGRVRFARKNQNQPLTHFKLGELEATGEKVRLVLEKKDDVFGQEDLHARTTPAIESHPIRTKFNLPPRSKCYQGIRTNWNNHREDELQ